VSQYQKGKTNLDYTEARDSEWQWHHHISALDVFLNDMRYINPRFTLLYFTGQYASLHLDPDRQPHQHPTTQFFYRPDALPVAQPTASKH